MARNKFSTTMRVYHRYLGFFLAGIMGVYAVSGIVMIFRDRDFLKREEAIHRTIEPNLGTEELAKELGVRSVKINKEEGKVLIFKDGRYDRSTGEVNYTSRELPPVLKKMTQLHKATSKQPLFFLNVFFGFSLFFFVISSFWMFMPKTSIFKKGMVFTIAGVALTLLLLFL